MPSNGHVGAGEFFVEIPQAPDTVTSSVLDLCPLTSVDPLGLLAAWAVLQGYYDLSQTPVVDDSRDIPVVAALCPELLPQSRDSVVQAGTRSEETDSVKKEVVSLEEDLFLSDIDTDEDDDDDDYVDEYNDDPDRTIIDNQGDSDYGSDYDSDFEDDDDDNDGPGLSHPDESFLGKNFRTNASFLGQVTGEQIGNDAFRTFLFGEDPDKNCGSASFDDDSSEYDSSDSDSSDFESNDSDSSDSDSNDCCSSDSESTDNSDVTKDDESDDDVADDCPENCPCKVGSLIRIAPIRRRHDVVSPLYKKLLRYRFLRRVKRFQYECCEDECSVRWSRMRRYEVTIDYD